MNRFGLHYYPDSHHYQQCDLDTWLPILQQLGAGWLVLDTPVNRALPESFIRGLIKAEVEPILHFLSSPEDMPPAEELDLLFKVYARWGVKYVVLFDRPNMQSTWDGSSWSQSDLVERFLDLYLPLAEAARNARLRPIFPPLEPGGDYWDTIFLKTALESMRRRGYHSQLKTLILGAYANISENPLNYGIGGPERWPKTRPYLTPKGEQDQRGLRIFDWYDAIAKSVLIEPRPVFLFGIGNAHDSEKSFQTIRLLNGENDAEAEPIPDFVLGGAFWLLTASEGSPYISQAWFQPGGKRTPIVDKVHQWRNSNPKSASPTPAESRPISHYVLLPAYEWGIPDYHFDALRPYIKTHKPTIGFSLNEATKAQRVTVIGSEEEYPEEALRLLRSKGCVVERIQDTPDGTTLASRLAKLT